MLLVGLTGGIGSGKSSASKRFVELGVAVISADRIARELLARDSNLLDKIKSVFGEQYLDPDGQLERKKISALVFSDQAARKSLEAIMHPPIRKEMLARALSNTKAPYVILEVPLLFESGMDKQVDRTLVIDVDTQTQRNRVADRDSLEATEIRKIIASQLPREKRIELADDIIENNQSLSVLYEAVDKMHNKYLLISQTT